MSAVGLDEAKEHLNVSKAEYDGEVQSFIDRVEQAIGNRTGPLTVRSKTVRRRGRQLALPTPAVSLTSVTPVRPAGAPYAPADLDLDTDTGIVSLADGGSFPDIDLEVVYQYGWAELPEDLHAAVLEMLRHFWTTQRGNGSTAARNSSAITPFAVPYFVQTLIEPYLQAGTS